MTDGNTANRMQCPMCGMTFATFDGARKHNCLRSSAHITTTPAPAMTQPPEAGDLRPMAAEQLQDIIREAWGNPVMLSDIEAAAELLSVYEKHRPKPSDLEPSDLRSSPAPSQGDVEAVARALYEEDDPWHKAWPWPNLNPEAQGGQGAADAYRRLARAAIAAMPVSAGYRELRDFFQAVDEMTTRWAGTDKLAGIYPHHSEELDDDEEEADWERFVAAHAAVRAALSDDDGKEGR